MERNKIKKIVASILCIALLAGSTVGCGKSDTSNETSSNTSSGNSDSGGAEIVTLKIMSTIQTEAEAPLELEMVNAFMDKNPNIKIELVGVPSNEISKKIISLSTSNDLPDAFMMINDFIPQAVDMGIVVDHSKVLGDDYLSDITPAAIDGCTVNGKLALSPWYVIPTGLIYRTDWLAESGISKIETMDDFKAAAKAFTKDGHWGFSMVGTNNASGTSRFKQFVKAYGVREVYQTDDGKWASDLTTDKYKEALQDFVDLVLVDKTVPTGVTETGYPEASAYFSQGQTGLMLTGSNAIGAILSANPDLDGKIGSVPVPKQEMHVAALNPMGYAITTACKHPEEMAMFLKFLTEKEQSVNFAVKTGRLPVSKEAADDAIFKTPIYEGFIAAMNYAISQPEFVKYSEVMDVMGESYSMMLGNGLSADEAMKQVTTRMNALLDEANK